MPDQHTLEELLRNLQDFERTHKKMSPDLRRDFEAVMKLVRGRLAEDQPKPKTIN